MKIAYLSSPSLLLEASSDPVGQAEFELQFNCLSSALATSDIGLIPLAWNDPSTFWGDYAAVLIGTTWDYWEKPELFLQVLQRIEAENVTLFNSCQQVIWNSRKTYLKDLQSAGIPTIPTLWLDHPTTDGLEEAFERWKTDRIVVKRQIGAGSMGQLLLSRGDTLPDYPHSAMVQPFVESIQAVGEYSFLFFDGDFSHALLKRPKAGDYRVQGHYGGWETRYSPDKSELTLARSVLDPLGEMPLYARVDLVRAPDDTLWLIELELIEPYLYPEQTDGLGERFASALLRRLSAV
ncbi:MAG: hypothetical protein CMK09_01960 [Ponticaulis sp.]|nr:hypothetical protein [Ponticaulis sp.]|tara:strand:+ start:12759 stop:13637 length:879 start_codon:yes stop_codon:yes gene_type:complete